MHIPWNPLCVQLSSSTKKPASDFHCGLSPAGICRTLSSDLCTFSVLYPYPRHSQECMVINASCEGLGLPTAIPHGPQLGEAPRPSVCMRGSAIPSINNSIWFNSACAEPYLFLWGITESITALFPVYEDQETKPAMLISLQTISARF